MKKALIISFIAVLSASAQAPYRAVLFDGSLALPWAKLMALALAGIVHRDSTSLCLQNAYEPWGCNQTDEGPLEHSGFSETRKMLLVK